MMVLFWVDAGPAFGLGHTSRALALAEALVARGLPCRFALPPDPTALAWVGAAGLPRPILLPERDPVLPDVLAAAVGARAVVVDVRHPLSLAEVRALGGTKPVLVVDNPGDGAAAADLVLAPFAAVTPEGPSAARWLVGPEVVPLRRGFQDVGRPARPAGGAARVLVSMGGSDPGGLTVPVVKALAPTGARSRFEVQVVANPASAVWGSVGEVLGRLGLAPPCAAEPERMAEHLADADVAVLAMGVTVYEAMAAGTPAVVLCRTSGDVAHARALEERGAIVSLGQHWTGERVRTAVGEVASAPARLEAMRRAGRTLVDGRGAERVAARLARLLEEGREADAERRAHA
jgi:UDP-2,4-diacetamido-2,4,6-trideoxy-beta-L-altropyranose hydrolase